MRALISWLVLGSLVLASSVLGDSLPRPPLVPEGEDLGDIESILANVSRQSPVWSVAFSPDGKTLASGSDDNTVRLWDLERRVEIARLDGHSNGVLSVAFSPDGKILASASGDHTVRLWDVQRGADANQLLVGHTAAVNSVAFSPDSKTVASVSHDGMVRLWDVQRGVEIKRLGGHSNLVVSVAFSPDGQILASGSYDGTGRLWNIQRGVEIYRLEGHSSWVVSVAFSPDGQILASGSEDATVRLWDIQRGVGIGRLEGHTGSVQSIAFSADNNTLASGSDDGTVRLWDVRQGFEIARFEGHLNGIRSVAFSLDGRILASGGYDGTVRLWDVRQGAEIMRFEGHSAWVRAIAFSSDGKTLASGSDEGTVRLWDMRQRVAIAWLEGHSGWVLSLAFSPDGKTLASGSKDNKVHLWDVQRGAENYRLEGHFDWVRAIAFSPDGDTLASGSDDNTVRLWDVQRGAEVYRLEGHSRLVRSVVFSPDGETLVSGSDDNTVRLWDVQRGVEIGQLEGHTFGIQSVAFSSNGETLISVDDDTVRLWDIQRGIEIKQFDVPLGVTLSVAMSPNGKAVAASYFRDGIRLLDTRRGVEINRLKRHSKYTLSLVFSPDGKTLASGSDDGVVRLWTGQDWRNLSASFLGGSRGTWLACGSDGRCLRHDDGTLVVRRNSSGLLQPTIPGAGNAFTEISVETSLPDELTVGASGKSLTLRIRNTGDTRAFWVNVYRRNLHAAKFFTFRPSPTHPILDPGEAIELVCHVSAGLPYENPQNQVGELSLEVVSAHGKPIQLKPIRLRGNAPSLRWRDASWQRDGFQHTLLVNLTNVGSQPLPKAEYSVRVSDIKSLLPTITSQVTLAPDETMSVPFGLPGNYSPNQQTRIQITIRTIDPPYHQWVFSNQQVSDPTLPWFIYSSMIALFLAASASIFRLSFYLHPIVSQLSRRPEDLLSLPAERLQTARKLLGRIRRLNTVLDSSDVHPTWLDSAIDFVSTIDRAKRIRILTERLNVRSSDPHPEDPALRTLPFGAGFPLNLEQCLLYLPPPGRPAADIENALRQRGETRDQVTLVLAHDPAEQEKLHDVADDPGNMWVAPRGPEITRLLLARHPLDVLAGLIASQVRLTRISPYQMGGGANRAAIFFGRDQLRAHILNREAANYLLVGGRQIGKSSLLKAIERHYRDDPRVECHYLVLRGSELVGDLARAVGLPRSTFLDDLVSHLAVEDAARRRLVLIDEADAFIRAERGRGYATLQSLRSLSEEGRCHFILAGFWDLYDAVAFDYQSPLKNFGETLTVGALEEDACRELATRPMATMNLGYESDAVVERLVAATGGRANLISIACNEVLKDLDAKKRKIGAAALERALDSRAVTSALGGWKDLAGDDEAGNRLDRVLVYALIGCERFTLADAIRRLAELGEGSPPERVERSLERLELAFVLQRTKTAYAFPVPLMKERVLAQEPELLLERELGT